MPSTAFTTPSSVSKWTRRSLTVSRGSGIRDAGVDEGVQDVHDQVGEDDEERAQQHRALDHGQVAVDDRVVGQPPDAGDVEDRLGEDRAPEEDADVDAGRGDERRARAAPAVADDNAPLAQPLCARGPYV